VLLLVVSSVEATCSTLKDCSECHRSGCPYCPTDRSCGWQCKGQQIPVELGCPVGHSPLSMGQVVFLISTLSTAGTVCLLLSWCVYRLCRYGNLNCCDERDEDAQSHRDRGDPLAVQDPSVGLLVAHGEDPNAIHRSRVFTATLLPLPSDGLNGFAADGSGGVYPSQCHYEYAQPSNEWAPEANLVPPSEGHGKLLEAEEPASGCTSLATVANTGVVYAPSDDEQCEGFSW
jgi:hypothetical protein